MIFIILCYLINCDVFPVTQIIAFVKLFQHIVKGNTFKFNAGTDSFIMCIVINWYWLEEAPLHPTNTGMTNTWGVWPFELHCLAWWIPLRSNECITRRLWLITNRAHSKLLPQMTASVITFLISDLHHPFHNSHRSHSPDLDLLLRKALLMEPLLLYDWIHEKNCNLYFLEKKNPNI